MADESDKAAPSARLLVFMFTDLVDSTALARQLGDSDYVRNVLEPHNEIFRRLLRQIPEAREIKHTGDGFMATFAGASDAAHCALQFHHELRTAAWRCVPPQVRVGIHLGEAVDFADRDGTRADLAGDAPNMTARVMSLGEPGQTLLTKPAFDSARQSGRVFAPGGPASNDCPKAIDDGKPRLSWLNHGRYRFKGAADPFEVCEVGVVGAAPLKPPLDSDKGKRLVSEEEAAVLGWRPAPGLEIPRREQWFVAEKLGEGGFGEVWLARHQKTKEQRVFKFCFDSDRLRSFKRELTFFRLIQQHLGDRDDIARLYEVQMDEPPFFLESEHVPGGNLRQWSDHRGGLGKTPLEFRLRLLSAVARAVAAAHSLGIIHKDLKPSNILIAETPGDAHAADGGLQLPGAAPGSTVAIHPRLCDFGIGVLADRTLLEQHHITETGFTETLLVGNDSSRTGTRLYAPPESQLGKPATTSGDVYALGVMLYQLVTGDLSRPLGTGWEEDISDALLREDILACTHRDPTRRPGAVDLVGRLEQLDKRRANRQALQQAAERDRRMRRLRAVTLSSLAAAVVLGALGGFSYVQWKTAQREKKLTEQALQESDRQRVRSANLALNRGLDFCQAGRVEKGMLWMTRGLEIVPPDAADLQWRLRTQLMCWSCQVDRWEKLDEGQDDSPAAFSPDASSIVAGGPENSLRQWAIANDQPIGPLLQHPGKVRAMAFSSDGKRLVTGGSAVFERISEARLWDLDTGESLGALQTRGAMIRAASFSIDGKRVLTCSEESPAEQVVQQWETSTRQPVGRPIFLPSFGQIQAVACSSDGTMVATVSELKGRVWEVDGKLVASFPCDEDVESIVFSPDNQRIAVGGRKVHVWDLKTSTHVCSNLLHQAIVTSLAFSPDGKFLLTGSLDGARLWDLARSNSPIRLVKDLGAVRAVAFSPDSKRAYTAINVRRVLTWDVATGTRVDTPAEHDQWHHQWHQTSPTLNTQGPLLSLALSPDGKILAASSGEDPTVRLWDATTWKPLAPAFEHRAAVNSVAFSPDGRTLLTGSDDKSARLWSTATGNAASGPMEHPGFVQAVAFSPDGKTVATACESTVRLWDAATAKPRGRLEPEGFVNAVAFSPDGKTILTGAGDTDAIRWDVAACQRIGSPLRHERLVEAVAYSPDGQEILTGCLDGTLHLWSAATGKRLFPPLRHLDGVVSVAFSPDGKMVATGDRNSSFHFWERATGKELGSAILLTGPSKNVRDAVGLGAVIAVVFSPDGETVVTASNRFLQLHGEIRAWKTPGPIQGTPERIALWAQVATGLQLDENGETHVLPADAWQMRRQELDRLGGPPLLGRPVNKSQ